MSDWKTKNRSDQKGAELVEASLVILLLVVLITAVFQFGRAYSIYQSITNAAREGARFAVAPAAGGTKNYPDPRALIEGLLRSYNLDPEAPGVNISVVTGTGGLNAGCAEPGSPCTTVRITYPVSFFVLSRNGRPLGRINISTTATMRRES